MRMCLSAFLFYLSLFGCSWAAITRSSPSAREQLINLLLHRYQVSGSKYAIPGPADGGPLQVTVNLTPTRVISLENDVLTLLAWEKTTWLDPRLSWEANGAYSKISRVVLPADLLWSPDIELYSSIEKREIMTLQNNLAVYRNGTIVSVQSEQLTSSCESQDTSANQETYNCPFKIGSWLYPGDTLDVSPEKDTVDLSLYQETEWKVYNASVSNNVVFYSCCPEPYVDVTYTMVLGKDRKA